MAVNKKGFILYCDLIHTIEQLPNDKAGELFKHILRYVNDLNPITDDLITNISFEPIKQQLKRDLKQWEESISQKSISGKLGNLKRWNNDLYLQVLDKKISAEEAEIIANSRKVSHPDDLRSHHVAEIAVTDKVTDKVIVKVKDKVKCISIEEKQKNFYESLIPFVDQYSKEQLRNFYEYWSEPNEITKKLRYELEKTFSISLRLKRWIQLEDLKPKFKTQIKPINEPKINIRTEW